MSFDHLFIQPLNFDRSFDFYTQVLGWKCNDLFGEKSDASRLAFISFENFKMVLAEDHDLKDHKEKTKIYSNSGRISIHFKTENVDQTFSKVKSGSHIVVQPENNHWGTRWFMVQDPDGHQFGWQGQVK